jgi:hypothetical protein
MVGQTVKKISRTTNFTTGRITVVNATIDVNYGGGRVGRMKDQIVTAETTAVAAQAAAGTKPNLAKTEIWLPGPGKA